MADFENRPQSIFNEKPMHTSFLRPAPKGLIAWALAVLSGVAAAAQSPTEPGKGLPPTRLQYTSTLGTYQGYADEPVQSWREANDRVERIGGWKAYAKETKAGKP
ncbi:MAG: hypothetical protein RLZZ373_1532 [Pseudomonadota bacterium]